MADLLDRLNKKDTEKAVKAVRVSGGDLLDQLDAVPQPEPKRETIPRDTLERAPMTQARRQASETGMGEAFLVSAGRGINTIGRGIGVIPMGGKPEERAYSALSERRPITTGAGEIVGETAPFLPLGVGAAAIPSMAVRAPVMAGIGALEGATITTGGGGSGSETVKAAGIGGAIAGGLELVMPHLVRVSRKVYSRLTGKAPQGALVDPSGRPTPEFQDILDSTGTSFDDVSETALAELKRSSQLTPEQAARKARLESQNIPYTAADVSQDFAETASEQRLMSMASGDKGEPLRQAKLQQSEAFRERIADMVGEVAGGDEASVKNALSDRITQLRDQKNALYKEFADSSPTAAQIPIDTTPLFAKLMPEKEIDDLAITAGEDAVSGAEKLLVKYGIITDDAMIERFMSGTTRGKPNQVTPLNVGNFDQFRKAITALDKENPALKVMTRPIIRALDEEAGIVDDAIVASGIADESVLAPLKQARSVVREMKTDFSPDTLAGKLTRMKRDGNTPFVEASKTYPTIISAPVEQVDKLSTILAKSPEGRASLGDIQGQVMISALENSLKAATRKTSGIETIGGNMFAKYLDKIGDAKLKAIFKNNPSGLKRLKAMRQTALDITPEAAAVPKGSAPVILDFIKRAVRSPIIAPFTEIVSFIVNAGADDRAIRRALSGKPKIKRSMKNVDTYYPALSSALGIPAILAVTNEEQE